MVCTCESQVQCQGCGAKHCGTHPVGMIPNPVYVEPEPKPVRVKAWVRWAKDGTWHHVTKIQPPSDIDPVPSYQLVDEWYSLSKLIKDGCEHTDTPDDETSWQKIGGKE